jgi:ribosome-associated heat shock protein Hsp15
MAAKSDLDAMRIDKLLWYLRFFKSRSIAQTSIFQGHVRLNGIRVIRASVLVQVNDVITLPKGSDVIVIRLISMPQRRGPLAEAITHYCSL